MLVNELFILDNIACLKQGGGLLDHCLPDHYTAKIPECFNSSIGGHIRHVIDHYQCMLSVVCNNEGGGNDTDLCIDYDERQRDALVESDVQVGAQRIEEICAMLQQLEPDHNPIVAVKLNTGSNAADIWTSSTLQREFQFLLSHTVHHYALIAIIGSIIGIPIPRDFGLAPSTLRYRSGAAH